MSLNDDIPPRINLKINDVHTIKAEEEKEFYPCHQVDLLQLKEELLYIEKDHLAIEDTNLNKTENLEVKNEVESEILLNDASPLVNLNMKSNELRIKDFHTVKTKDGMVFYPCRVIIEKLTIKRSTKNNCKSSVNNSNFCQKSVIPENNLKTQLIKHNEEKNYVCTICPKTFNQSSELKSHLNVHTKEKIYYVCKICHKVFNLSDVGSLDSTSRRLI
ncbi:uncharacterized protein LOC142321191 [Lycorma delicatula]|uniref:uncharacterized protein LOC142321190 n=1 Tax=Lycorma delicatula TaxID=130591 RepID=UPI003F5117C1